MNYKYCLCLLVTCLFFGSGFSQALLNEQDTLSINRSINATASDFDLWISQELETLENSDTPSIIYTAVIYRLRKELFIADDLLISSILAVENYETQLIASKRISAAELSKKDNRYKQTRQYIDAIENLIYKRPFLQVKLTAIKSRLYYGTGQGEKGLDLQIATISQVDELHQQIDQIRIKSYYQIGTYLKDRNRFEEAEEYLTVVLGYPWYKWKDQQLMQYFQGYYVGAAKGIIVCRQDQPERLKRTFFVPATRSILDPIKAEAISKAERKD